MQRCVVVPLFNIALTPESPALLKKMCIHTVVVKFSVNNIDFIVNYLAVQDCTKQTLTGSIESIQLDNYVI